MWVVVVVALWPAGGPIVDVLALPNKLSCQQNADDWKRAMRSEHPTEYANGGFIIKCVLTDAYHPT